MHVYLKGYQISSNDVTNDCLHSLLSRLCTTGSTHLPVMCGAMEYLCMRYGAWDTSHLRDTQTHR